MLFRSLEVIHNDVWITKTTSIRGCNYYVSFIDDHARKVWVYFMKEKSEVLSHSKNFRAMVENKNGMHIKLIRFDGGGKYFL